MHRSPVRCLTALVLLIALAVVAGCNTPTHRVRIEAEVNTPPAGTPRAESFFIKSRQADPRVETLRYHEAVGHIKTALSGRGLYEAPNEASADMVIEIDYGAAPKRQRVEVEETRSARRRADKSATASASTDSTAKRPELPAAETAVATTASHSTSTDADEEVSAERRGEIMIDVSLFKKHLTLEARRNRAKPGNDAGPEMLWRVRVENEDESKDLRKYVPILASATIDYIAAETHGEKEVVIDENGQDVRFVKKGL